MSLKKIETLIQKCAKGERRAFQDLYKLTHRKLFGVCMRYLGNQAEAEEALQEIYIRIRRYAPRFMPGQNSPMTWLIAIARNYSIDVIRARKPEALELGEDLQLADEGKTPEAQAMLSDDRRRLEDCLERLDANKAKAVKAAYMEGYSYQELADHYVIPLNTIRTWLRRSLIALRECLS